MCICKLSLPSKMRAFRILFKDGIPYCPYMKLNMGSRRCISKISASPTFHFKVMNRMVDKVDSIQIKGLKPSKVYTLTSQTQIDSGNKFGCKAYYRSNQNGLIDLEKHPSLGGLFVGVEPMGWFWAMEPSPLNRRDHARFLKEKYETPVEVKLGVTEGTLDRFVDIFDGNLNTECDVIIDKWWAEEGVTKTIIDECGVKGSLFIPAGEPPFPGLISMYGGALTAISHDFRPALLASHGFATLSLEFMSGFETFVGDIDLTIFEDAVNYLLNHKDVKSDGVGVYGISKGGSLVLAIAAYLENIKCAVAINCSIFSDHSRLLYKGRMWPNYEIHLDMLSEDKLISDCYSMYPCFKLPSDDPEVEMPDQILEFYKSDVPLMYAASLDDRNVPTPRYVEYVENLLKKYNHPCYEVHKYEGAGHLLEPPYSPLCAGSYAPIIDNMLVWGGNPLEHCRAQEQAWKRHIQFLKTHLP